MRMNVRMTLRALPVSLLVLQSRVPRQRCLQTQRKTCFMALGRPLVQQ